MNYPIFIKLTDPDDGLEFLVNADNVEICIQLSGKNKGRTAILPKDGTLTNEIRVDKKERKKATMVQESPEQIQNLIRQEVYLMKMYGTNDKNGATIKP